MVRAARGDRLGLGLIDEGLERLLDLVGELDFTGGAGSEGVRGGLLGESFLQAGVARRGSGCGGLVGLECGFTGVDTEGRERLFGAVSVGRGGIFGEVLLPSLLGAGALGEEVLGLFDVGSEDEDELDAFLDGLGGGSVAGGFSDSATAETGHWPWRRR